MSERTRCIEPEELDALLVAGAGDPMRVHAETCPRCRALVASHALFMEARDEDPVATRRADEALTAFRERLLAPEPPRAPRRAEARGWRAWFAPATRPAWAIAAVLLVVGAWVLAPREPEPVAPPPPLRGGGDAVMTLGTPAIGADGGVLLSWRRSRMAQAYEVRFYSSSMAEIARHSTGPATLLRLAPEGMPAAYQRHEVILYRVYALSGGDEVARSPVGTLQRR